MIEIFIPGNVPSSKHGYVIAKRGRFYCLVHGKATKAYIQQTDEFFQRYAEEVKRALQDLPKPYRIGFKYARKSRHIFDYINAQQIVQDRMVEHGWIEDDNSDVLLPEFIPYVYDKLNPGVYITI